MSRRSKQPIKITAFAFVGSYATLLGFGFGSGRILRKVLPKNFLVLLNAFRRSRYSLKSSPGSRFIRFAPYECFWYIAWVSFGCRTYAKYAGLLCFWREQQKRDSAITGWIPYIFVEPTCGIEPQTCWLRISCSTIWATPAFRASRGQFLSGLSCKIKRNLWYRRSSTKSRIALQEWIARGYPVRNVRI